MKRVFDIGGALAGLLFILPFAPFIAIAVFLESGWPVMVKLDRVSAGRIIKIYKFRSMKKGAEKEKINLDQLNERNDGPLFKLKDDPRVTRVGRFLRRTRLDEFPQLINVLKNELSLVGPRPHEPEEMLLYTPEYWQIFLFKAGVTGISQVSASPYLPFKEEIKMDKHYIEKQSLSLDLKIILKTIWIFFTKPDGI